ncbi:hypothetical protein PFISCL1PPCAC_28457, partial [Pristionchus fissidentatus]
AAKITTTCKPEFVGCTQIDASTPLIDNVDNKCPEGSFIFYKVSSDDSYFTDSLGDSIKCDTAKGEWKVSKGGVEKGIVIRRGNTVICAPNNPKPEPTTTPVPKEVCGKCPSFNDMCSGCVASEADFKTKSDGESRCNATITAENFYVNGNKFNGKLSCNANEEHPKWKSEDGKEVAKFSAKVEKEEGGASVYVIIGAVVGVVFVFIIFGVIWKVCCSKKTMTAAEENTKRLEEEKLRKKKNQKKGANDEILDEVDVEAPEPELQL